WPESQNLTHLEFAGYDLTIEGMRALAEAGLPQLRSLKLRYPRVETSEVWELLRRAGGLKQLEELAVAGLGLHPMSSELVAPLCAQLRLGKLRSLTLDRVGLGDAEAAELARSGLLASVPDLQLIGNDITVAGAELLVDALPPTGRLLLDDNPLAR